MAATPPEIRTRPAARLAAALTIAATLAGCGGNPPGDGPAGGPGSASGQAVEVDGSSTVFRISREAMQAFKAAEPKVEVFVNKTGTGGGFGKYLKGEVDIVDASRLAKPEEEARAKEQGLDWLRFLVGYDGITVVVNPKNTFVKELSVGQLKKLWAADSKVKTWKELDPSWPDSAITLYSPDKDSGTFEFFTEAVNGKAKDQRSDVQASSDDNSLVKGVAGDDDGIGYFGYAYFKANSKALRAVPIKKDDGAPAVMPDPATILSKSYAPLSRPLFIYVKKSALGRSGVASFVKYYVEHAGDLSAKAGYVAPTAEDSEANGKVLASVGGPAPASTH